MNFWLKSLKYLIIWSLIGIQPAISETSGRSSCINAWKTSFLRMINAYPDASLFNWHEPRLSEAQFKNLIDFSRRAGKPLALGSTITVLPKEAFRLGTVTRMDAQQMQIEENNAFHGSLLKESGIDTHPREVLTIGYLDKQGHFVDFGFRILGNAHHVDFEAAIWEFKIRQGYRLALTSPTRTIELVHTHPFYAVRITPPGTFKTKNRANDLSAEDYYGLHYFSSRFPSGFGLTIRIRAVTPNGVNFASEVSVP